MYWRIGYCSLSGDSAYEKCERLQDTKLEDGIVVGGGEPHVTVVQDHEPIPRLYRESTSMQSSKIKADKIIGFMKSKSQTRIHFDFFRYITQESNVTSAITQETGKDSCGSGNTSRFMC